MSAHLSPYAIEAPPPGVRRLHLNEFRGEHALAVRLAIAREGLCGDPALYPVAAEPELVAAIAKYVAAAPGARGAAAENVLVAAGSDEVLRAVVEAAAARGLRAVVAGVPGYTHFEHHVRARGLRLVTYALGLRRDAGAAALRYYRAELEEGALVYIGSPNNPTGDDWTGEAVAAIAAEYPASLFLVDEAYVEYAGTCQGLPDPAEYAGPAAAARAAAALNAASAVAAALEAPNVIVSRTFSKAFGLAALRVGYAVGRPEALAPLRVWVSPKSVGRAACVAGAAVLRSLPHYAAQAADVMSAGRDAVAALKRSGWWVADTPANYFLAHVGATPAGFVAPARLAAAGVAVRGRDELPGLGGFVRVTKGSAADMRAVVAAFAALGPPPPPPLAAAAAPKPLVAELKELARDVHAVLARGGVRAFAQGGTLLGLVRHGGAMPWDDDVDLAYVRGPRAAPGTPAADPVGGLAGSFADAGLRLRRNRTDAYWQIDRVAGDSPLAPAHVDLFSYACVDVCTGECAGACAGAGADGVCGSPCSAHAHVLEDPRFAAEDPESAGAHCNTAFGPGELEGAGVVAGDFYGTPLLVPAGAAAALGRALGPDFMAVARVREGGASRAVPLRPGDLAPA